MMKFVMVFAALAVSLFAQMPPTKSRMDDTKGGIALRAAGIINAAGQWNTKLWISSPNATTFKICLRYFDGTTTRSLIKVVTAERADQPATITLEVPLEVVESGSLYIYEMVAISVGEFDAR